MCTVPIAPAAIAAPQSPYLLNFSFGGDFSYIKYSVDDKLTYFAGDHIIEAGIGADFRWRLQ